MDASTGLAETLEAVKETFENHPRAGIACAMKSAGVGVGIPDYGRAILAVENGKLHIRSGASCIGQGLGTVLVQMTVENTDLKRMESKIILYRRNCVYGCAQEQLHGIESDSHQYQC